MNIADMLIDVYVGESLLLRVEKLAGLRGEAACAVHIDMVRTWLTDAADRLHKSGKDAINAFTEGDEQRMKYGRTGADKYETDGEPPRDRPAGPLERTIPSLGRHPRRRPMSN